jgi:hypothetical protein
VTRGCAAATALPRRTARAATTRNSTHACGTRLTAATVARRIRTADSSAARCARRSVAPSAVLLFACGRSARNDHENDHQTKL